MISKREQLFMTIAVGVASLAALFFAMTIHNIPNTWWQTIVILLLPIIAVTGTWFIAGDDDTWISRLFNRKEKIVYRKIKRGNRNYYATFIVENRPGDQDEQIHIKVFFGPKPRPNHTACYQFVYVQTVQDAEQFIDDCADNYEAHHQKTKADTGTRLTKREVAKQLKDLSFDARTVPKQKEQNKERSL